MGKPLIDAAPYRTGDLVAHGPAGPVDDVLLPSRRIVVGFIDGDTLHGVFGRAVPTAECWLLNSVSDADHRALLLELSERDTALGRHARRELERLVESMAP